MVYYECLHCDSAIEYHYEVSKNDTKDGNPYVISLDLEDFEEFCIFDVDNGDLLVHDIKGYYEAECAKPDSDQFEILPSK